MHFSFRSRSLQQSNRAYEKAGSGLVNFIQTHLIASRTMQLGQRKKTTADRMHGGYDVALERMAKTAWLFYALNLLAL